jgi:hypothetical protein
VIILAGNRVCRPRCGLLSEAYPCQPINGCQRKSLRAGASHAGRGEELAREPENVGLVERTSRPCDALQQDATEDVTQDL